MSDKIQNFIDWLELNTDFSQWDELIKKEVHIKLIEFMISENIKEHDWEFYMNGTFCRKCGAGIGTDTKCN